MSQSAPRASADASGDPSAASDPSTLSPRSRSILTFERHWMRQSGSKDEAIRAQFGVASARYYQMLNAVLDEPEALAFDPMLVKRLHRIRDARTEARAARVLQRPDSQH